MKTLNKITLEELMHLIIIRVKENIAEIAKYNNASEDLLMSMSACKERTELLNSISSNIRSITKFNIPLFNLYYDLLNYYRTHKHPITEKEEVHSIASLLHNSNFVNGSTPENKLETNNMLMKNNVDLIEEYMNQCIKLEEYEKCAVIQSFLID